MEQVRTGVGVIIVNDENKVLLLHRKSDYKDTGGIFEPDTWTLPGGKQEYKEDLFECARREVYEETNLCVGNISVTGAHDDVQSDRHFVTVHCETNDFSGILDVKEKDKFDKATWFKLNKLPNNIYSPSKVQLLQYKEKTAL